MNAVKRWKKGSLLAAGILTVAQYILAFFVFKLPGLEALQWVGWGIWLLSLVFGVAPVFILRARGGVASGKSYIHTTKLVDTSLYAVVRHPQYVGCILLNLALMLLAQHWLVAGLGVIAMVLFYQTILEADQEGMQKFGDEYRLYMQRVPRLNFLLGLIWLIQRRKD